MSQTQQTGELYEFALTSAAMSFHDTAIESLQHLTARAPDHQGAWEKLAALLKLAGKDDAAEAASVAAGAASYWPVPDDGPNTIATGNAEGAWCRALAGLGPEPAMAKLREALFENPLDAAAMRSLAALERQTGDEVTARGLLERALEVAPRYAGARMDLVELLMAQHRYVPALDEIEILRLEAPEETMFRVSQAEALGNAGRHADAIGMWEEILQAYPDVPRFWLSYAKSLHYSGRRDETVRAYRTCLDLDPLAGEAYWGLADLKGEFITDLDLSAIRSHLAGAALDDMARMRMLYALAHTLERQKDFVASFAAYDAGARSFLRTLAGITPAHQVHALEDRIARHKAVFTAANLASRKPCSDDAAPHTTPIMIVGMPRAGSTLVEQILASHSMVEGTHELPLIDDITRDLRLSRLLVTADAYPECVLDLSEQELRVLGERYIEQAGFFRQTERPFFVDKRPWNWMDAGLIHLILPHARIIDVRRAPMAACFAMFKQVLPPEAAFTYDLPNLGRTYVHYTNLMRHWEAVMPGRILALAYERLIDDTEPEIRRLLDYCGLPFEVRCLRFWETDRVVSTPSAEQVRRPIYRDALEQWRNFEPWLGPLKESLRLSDP